jgi:hypothetical protein
VNSNKKKEWTTLFENGKVKRKQKQKVTQENQFVQGVCMIADD